MNRKNALTIFSMLIVAQLAFCQVSQDRLHYISKYQKIAQEEMERSGVPASIKLAQAILESNGGKSELSRKANNHFGIKCGGSWDGRTHFRMDDDKDDKGSPIKSCFRVYKNPESSFVAHSEFLRANQRYAFLFEMKHNDYTSWAHGLKKAGYATNPKYPHLLIKIIEDYELNQYDNLFDPPAAPMLADTGDDHMLKEIAKIEGGKKQTAAKKSHSKKKSLFATNKRAIADKKLNDISVVYAKQDETPEEISARTDVPMNRLFKYNERLTNANQAIPENTVVYLQPKRKAFRGKKKFHKVNEGESLAQVSQKYGLRIDKLQERNRLAINEEPLEGAILKIRGKRVPENIRIPTREVYVAGMDDRKEELKKVDKYATSLSDFEAPPSIQERKEPVQKEKKKRLFNFGKKKKVKNTSVADHVPPSDSYKAAPAYGDEVVEIETIKARKDTYDAPSASSNYSTTPSSGNATFKENTTVSSSNKPYTSPASSDTYASTGGTIISSNPSVSNTTATVTNSAPVRTTTTVVSTYPSNGQVTASSSTSAGNLNNTSSPQSTRITSAPSTPSTGTNTYTGNANTTINSAPVVTTKYHTVAKGETLYRLSKNFGKTVDYLKQVNGLSSNTISIGQKLIVN